MSLKIHELVKNFDALKHLKNLLQFHTHSDLWAMTVTSFFSQEHGERCFQTLTITHTASSPEQGLRLPFLSSTPI